VKTLYSNFSIIYNEIDSLSLDMFSNRTLNSLVASDALGTSNQYITKQEIENILGQYMNTRRYVKSIRLYSRNLKCYSVENGIMINPDGFKDSKWFREAKEANGKMISTGSFNQIYDDWLALSKKEVKVISFARTIKELENSAGKDIIGVLVIDIKEEFLNQLFNMKVSENSFSVLYDKSGSIITQSANAPDFSDTIYESFSSMHSTWENSEAQLNVGSEEYYTTFVTFQKPGWTLLNLVPMQDMLMDNATISQYTVIFTVICILINILLSILMTQSISKPIKKLLSAINQVKKGNFSTKIKIYNRDEIGDIGNKFNEMVDNIDNLLKENYIVKLKEQEAQISSLQAQINPHFLYNTLDTINWKVMLAGQKDICKLISCLGEILRYGISKPNEIVTVEEDIYQIRNYLYIQQCRYGERFQARVNMHPDILKLKLHKLLIQPMVENAISHGLDDKEENGILEIDGFLEDNILVIRVFDNGCGIKPEDIGSILEGTYNTDLQRKDSHIGIYNVNKRMQLYYGKEHGIEIKSREGFYTEVFLRFPAIF